jgi:hypothetical protein
MRWKVFESRSGQEAEGPGLYVDMNMEKQDRSVAQIVVVIPALHMWLVPS